MFISQLYILVFVEIDRADFQRLTDMSTSF